MSEQQDIRSQIHDCENAVHDIFKKSANDPRALTNALEDLVNEFGQLAVTAAMTNRMKVAYLRLYGPRN